MTIAWPSPDRAFQGSRSTEASRTGPDSKAGSPTGATRGTGCSAPASAPSHDNVEHRGRAPALQRARILSVTHEFRSGVPRHLTEPGEGGILSTREPPADRARA